MGLPLAALQLSILKANQWKGASDLESLREERLLSLARHASEDVPAYGGLEIRSVEDLADAPLVTKAMLRDDPHSFLSRRHAGRRLEALRTSGSSGIPVTVYNDGHDLACRLALELHQLTAAGVGPLDLQAQLCHYSLRPGLIQRMGLFRKLYLPVQGDEAGMLSVLRRERPEALLGYPSVLVALARLNRAGEPGLGLRKAICFSETLTPQARSLIETSFSCDLRDFYGAGEVSWMAWECEEGRKHVHSDSVIIEVLDGKGKRLGPGKEGQLAVTPLWQGTMPLLRYLVGDRGSLGSGCPCGRAHPTIEVEGRDDDVITLPSGRVRSARSINLMDDIEGISSYQIIQERPDLFLFRVVPSGERFPEASMAEAGRRIRAGCLGEPVKVEFETVSRIPRSPTGKLRSVISKAGPRG
jgi:phenylacetate-CoA ligase